MPYLDQGEPKPVNLPPILPMVAVVVAMAAGVALFVVFYNQLNGNQWLAPLVTGPMIGAAMRLTSKRPLPKAGLIAVGSTVFACLVGYVVRHVGFIKWVDPNFEPTVGHAFEWLFSSDLMGVLLIGMSAYLAYTIGAAMPYRTQASDEGQNAS